MHVVRLHFEKLNPDQQYGNEKAGIEALPSPGESVADCFAAMKREVYDCLGLDTPAESYATPVDPTPAPVVEEKPVVEAVEAKPKKEKKEKKEKAPKKEKVVLFNPESDTHRDTVATLLDELHPGWDTNESSIAKAKKLVRESLVGKDFLDYSGNVVDSFKEVIAAGMAEGKSVL